MAYFAIFYLEYWDQMELELLKGKNGRKRRRCTELGGTRKERREERGKVQ